jgi:hypothetical protein
LSPKNDEVERTGRQRPVIGFNKKAQAKSPVPNKMKKK